LASFPKDLTDVVVKKWGRIVSGDYPTPKRPPNQQLRRLLEESFIATVTTEEARHPQFNIIVTADGDHEIIDFPIFRFEQPREFSASELRRLAPSTDYKKSAIWVRCHDSNLSVNGLVDLGTAWHRARLGFSNSYNVPRLLIIVSDRPGRLRVYEGEYFVAELADGKLNEATLGDFNFFIGQLALKGLEKIGRRISIPKYEHPRESHEYWFIAYCNVISVIANSISLSGHGGMIVILHNPDKKHNENMRIKYLGNSSMLTDGFVDFINARNKIVDIEESSGKRIWRNIYTAERDLYLSGDKMTESMRFISQLAGCDGSIILDADLSILGFGAEIRAELKPGISVVEQIGESFSGKKVPCDIEQFGMRHRSAIKLASQTKDALVLTMSQDGPITAIWLDEGENVIVRKGVTLRNFNQPWM